MKPLTKTLVYGGVATAILGPALVAGVAVSVGQGVGTFAKVLISDGVPALIEGSQYEGGDTPGILGEDPNAPTPEG